MIQFAHTGHLISAKVIYNFNQVSDVVVVMPREQMEGLDEFILFHRLSASNWGTTGHIKKQYPQTTHQLENLLQPVFAIGEQSMKKKNKAN